MSGYLLLFCRHVFSFISISFKTILGGHTGYENVRPVAAGYDISNRTQLYGISRTAFGRNLPNFGTSQSFFALKSFDVHFIDN